MNLQTDYAKITARIENALQFVDETKRVVIGENNLAQTAALFQELFPGQSAVIISDPNTFRVAGQFVQRTLENTSSLTVSPPFLFEDKVFHAGREQTDRLVHFLQETAAVPIAVGSGTINDLTKLASYESQRRYMNVATAASMDGYTSYGASIEINSFKQTRFCPAPLAVLVDMQVICGAPVSMNAAGYADLLAKITAGADWILADLIGTEPIDSIAWDVIQPELRNWLQNPAGIQTGDKKTLLNLIEGLIMSGLAMQKAKSSRTASGAEHLLSHLWDNQHHTCNGIAPSHGFKVGIGTLVAASLYEKFLSMTKEQFREHCNPVRTSFRDWSVTEAEIKQFFDDEPQREQALQESKMKFADRGEIERRYKVFLDNWEPLQKRLRKQLLPVKEIREMLLTSGAPSRPQDIAVSKEYLLSSCSGAKMIRSRYNILDFAAEHGLWNDWIPPVTESL
ncbi:3-dehydroquinate synthase [Planctomycetales bacterium]|nr:3-dehydroquinate synthase [Planctomycetales bacterium]